MAPPAPFERRLGAIRAQPNTADVFPIDHGELIARVSGYITGTVEQQLLPRNEYLATENRILKARLKGRPLVDRGRALAVLAQRRRILEAAWMHLPAMSTTGGAAP